MNKICFQCKERRVCKIRPEIYDAFNKFWHMFNGKETLNEEIHILIASHCKEFLKEKEKNDL